MFNEHEIAAFLNDSKIAEAVVEKKNDFIRTEAELLEINDHDFLSLIMMTPCVGVAKANGNVSLFEELALNKRARKMSKGGYFLKMDPVAHAMKYLIKNYDNWEPKFIEVIDLCAHHSFNKKEITGLKPVSDVEDELVNFTNHVILMPYGFIRFLSSFYVKDESHLIKKHEASKVEYEKMVDIGKKLAFDEIPAYQAFLKIFKVK